MKIVSVALNCLPVLVVLLLSQVSSASDYLSPGISADELSTSLGTSEAPLVVDVRKPAEYAIAHIPGAINIPHGKLSERLEEVRGENGVLIYCFNGARTRQAEPLLFSNGIDNVYHLQGAFQGWIKEQLPIEKGGIEKSW